MACQNAEKYLVQIKYKTSPLSSFDELRYQEYTYNNKAIMEHSPTSNTVRLHILRALYITHKKLNLLNNDWILLNLENFGYEYMKVR